MSDVDIDLWHGSIGGPRLCNPTILAIREALLRARLSRREHCDYCNRMFHPRTLNELYCGPECREAARIEYVRIYFRKIPGE